MAARATIISPIAKLIDHHAAKDISLLPKVSVLVNLAAKDGLSTHIIDVVKYILPERIEYGR